ncbi:flavin-containing monooxygenase [Nocardioides sp. SYSU DS0651]|uniref:flavin-containing monooxygenase n=1 Tax=Nocardioides sp. SYSU DS0651 TaxID=3415955 RepID=UPI003F4C321C
MTHVHDAVIVGAGFGGMGAAIQLRRLGYDDLAVLERESGLGGTWHVNRYPGLAVDIPSSTYSYSFEPNPFWSRLFAPGPELKRYAEHVADKYDLRRHMRFGVVVTDAEWDDDAAVWRVHTESGDVVSGRYLLTATGFLSQPRTPDIPGIEEFAGTIVHTAAWDDDVELTGKRVGIIGTGATAVQLIPELARVASHLTVYQRTPIWVSPKIDGPVPGGLQKAFARVPLTQRAVRLAGTGILEVMMVAGVLHYRDLPLANRIGATVCRNHLHRQVRDPSLREKLTPRYSFGCKRPTFSNDYYPTLCRDDVDLETASIDRVDAEGIVTADGRRADLDVLVLATGFDLWETNFPAFRIVGRDGRDLGKWWRDNRFVAYEGVTVPKLPNFISLNSPYSYSGLSYFTTIEYQMAHIRRLLSGMRQRGAEVFEVTETATQDFLDRMQERLQGSVFVQGDCASARSYYFNQHGEAVLLRPTSTLQSRWEARRFPLDDYRFRAAS